MSKWKAKINSNIPELNRKYPDFAEVNNAHCAANQRRDGSNAGPRSSLQGNEHTSSLRHARTYSAVLNDELAMQVASCGLRQPPRLYALRAAGCVALRAIVICLITNLVGDVETCFCADPLCREAAFT